MSVVAWRPVKASGAADKLLTIRLYRPLYKLSGKGIKYHVTSLKCLTLLDTESFAVCPQPLGPDAAAPRRLRYNYWNVTNVRTSQYKRNNRARRGTYTHIEILYNIIYSRARPTSERVRNKTSSLIHH